MSDAVISPGEDYLHLLDTVAVPRWVFADFLNNQPGWPDTARRYLNAPALAASTPVGGWGEPVAWQRRMRNTSSDASDWQSTWSEWKQCTEEQANYASKAGHVEHAPEVVAEVRPIYAAPPPPSVSIDKGSRPQEAVPTGDAEPAVVDRRPFADVFAEAYGWTVDVDGYLAGLVAGDMGYDQTDLLLSDLLVDAQVAEDRRNRTIKGGPYSWPFHEALMAFVSTGHAARTQPADGCSSNEGAG